MIDKKETKNGQVYCSIRIRNSIIIKQHIGRIYKDWKNKMKIIISHDVDHLYRSDHYKDLIIPKLFVRESIALAKRRLDFTQWHRRISGILSKNINHIEALAEFDKKKSVRSSFFFGMANGLGMSYNKFKAAKFIDLVRRYGFEAGVHGIEYKDEQAMKAEFNDFRDISATEAKGIRMHYVRFDSLTFQKLSACGYIYDSTEFDKQAGCCIKAPYKVNTMWEFPLCVMDCYLPNSLQNKKKMTIQLLDRAEKQGLPYFTMLLHDFYYCDAYVDFKSWYEWSVDYFIEHGYPFISYLDAVRELETKRGGNVCAE